MAAACASLSFNSAICSSCGVGAVVPVAFASFPCNSAISSCSGVGDAFGAVVFAGDEIGSVSFGVARFLFLLALSLSDLDAASVKSVSSCASWLSSVLLSSSSSVELLTRVLVLRDLFDCVDCVRVGRWDRFPAPWLLVRSTSTSRNGTRAQPPGRVDLVI